jgi:NADPH-dependent ferric siderophore reductase
MTLLSPVRRVQRVRHEVRRREVEVRRVERLSPHYVAVTFAGESLADFASEGFDDHVKFMFDAGAGELVRRDYTPRRFDRDKGELTIEFLLHEEGEACEWAARAEPGMAAVIGGPKSSMVIPVDYRWHLLAGDAAALPAIHRRLEELPEGTEAIVRVQLDDPADRRDLVSAARLDVAWLSADEDLASHLRVLPLPESEGFAWCAGEAASMASVREVLLVERRHPREAMRVAAYWKKRSEGSFHETLESGLIPEAEAPARSA